MTVNNAISAERRTQIESELDRLAAEHDVRILVAVESGSRAWGFPSADSDYDVRMIYAHRRDWYLSVHEQRDVIEQPVSDLLDIGGWDLRKALRLLTGGNAVVHEWLGSPIIYRQAPALGPLRELAGAAFNPRAAFHHYFAMAAGKLDVAGTEALTAKRFLYGLRTLLCARWVYDQQTAPPMLFVDLLDRYVLPGKAERDDVDRLIRLKAGGSESDTDTGLGGLLDYAQDMVEQVRRLVPPAAFKLDAAILDAGFRNLLD